MAQYSKITRISDVIDRHHKSKPDNGSAIGVISDILARVTSKAILQHILHIGFNDNTIDITVNDQSIRQLLQLKAREVIRCIYEQTNLVNISKITILFDTQ